MKTDLRTNVLRLFANSPIAGPLVTLIVVYILFFFTVPNFATWRTLSGIITAVSISEIVTIGITILMVAGEFDLSLAPMIAMSGYLFGSVSTGADSLITQTLSSIGFPVAVGEGNIALAMFLGLAIPALMGLINGLILISTNIPSFIVTLGTRQIYHGLVWIVAGAELLQVLDEPAIFGLLNGRMDGFNEFVKTAVLSPESRDRVNFRHATLWLMALVSIYQFVLIRTKFGNHIFAVGGNDGAARAQGVRSNRTRLYAFVISGVLAGFAPVMRTFSGLSVALI